MQSVDVYILLIIISVLLGLICLGSGLANVSRVPQMMTVIKQVGADKIVTPLGVSLIAGALGLWIGLAWAPLGIAAA